MKVQLKENKAKILQIDLKRTTKLHAQKTIQSEILQDFIEGVEAMTGRTFKEFYTLLTSCAWELAEANGYLGKESYLSKATELAHLYENLAIFAKEANVPLK